MPKPSPAAVDTLLTRNVVTVVDRAHLRRRLLARDTLRVKLGIDPTAPDIHLGFAVVMKKLREFQDAGHTAVLIIGDATAAIGDPSGRKKTRPQLSPSEIHANMRTYLTQAGQILNMKRAEIRRNSEWLGTLSFLDLIQLLQKFTVARILEREDFAQRLKIRSPIGFHELVYPIIQAYDSVAVRADVELGAVDQTLNVLAGRDLQPHVGQEPQDVLLTPLLVGLDGTEKMSKSLGNYVGITESPDAMIGKLMTVPDSVIPDYARLAADWSEEQLQELPRRLKQENPRDVKLGVARDIVALYHSAPAAAKAATEWLRIFHGKELPKDIPTQKLRAGSWDVADLLVAAGLAASKSEARRLVAQGGVHHNDVRAGANAKTLSIRKGDLLQVGKRKFLRVM